MKPSFRTRIATGALVASLCACSTGNSGGTSAPPPTAPPTLSGVANAATSPVTVFLPSVNVSIPPVATAGAQPAAALTAASPYVTIPPASPVLSNAACGVNQTTGQANAGLCPNLISFASSAVAPAGVPGFSPATAYLTLSSNVPLTLVSQPTIGFSLAPFPLYRTPRLYAYTGTAWVDTGVTGAIGSSSVVFAGGATPLALTTAPVVFALVIM